MADDEKNCALDTENSNIKFIDALPVRLKRLRGNPAEEVQNALLNDDPDFTKTLDDRVLNLEMELRATKLQIRRNKDANFRIALAWLIKYSQPEMKPLKQVYDASQYKAVLKRTRSQTSSSSSQDDIDDYTTNTDLRMDA